MLRDRAASRPFGGEVQEVAGLGGGRREGDAGRIRKGNVAERSAQRPLKERETRGRLCGVDDPIDRHEVVHHSLVEQARQKRGVTLQKRMCQAGRPHDGAAWRYIATSIVVNTAERLAARVGETSRGSIKAK